MSIDRKTLKLVHSAQREKGEREMKGTILLCLLTATFMNLGFAQDPMYEITRVRTQVLEEGPSAYSEYELEKGGKVGQVLAVLDGIIAIGEKVYKIVKAGEPVATTKYAPVSVLPRDSKGDMIEALSLENWNYPKSRKIKIVFENGFGMDVVTFVYTITFSYGGRLDGQGRYLTGVMIVPDEVSLAWGFDFNSEFKVHAITNHGTKADPVAGATLELSYTVQPKLPIQVRHYRTLYHVTGNGMLKEI